MRPIDHVVLPVTTLALARSRLTSLGFTVAPDARHPFGTGNCCVFFADHSFLEPITIVDRTSADMAAAEGLFFVKRLKRFTERHGEGFAMVALRSADAEADSADFDAAPPFRFTRRAVLPDGNEAEVGFALAAAENPAAPDATLFACQHIATHTLFQSAYMEHPNGAVALGGVAAVAETPAAYRQFIATVTGAEEIGESGGGFEVALGAQRLSVLTQAGYRDRFGLDPPDPRRGLLFAACEILVADIDRAIGYAGPTAMRHDGRIVIPPAPGFGAALAFMSEDHG